MFKKFIYKNIPIYKIKYPKRLKRKRQKMYRKEKE